MKRITFVLLYALLAATVSAQTIWVRTNEISGNVSPSESLTAVAGAIRLTVYSTDGGGAADLSGTSVRFLITDLRDDKIIVSNSPATVVSGSAHRGEATVSAGQPYAVRLMAYPDGEAAYALYWATLIVTNPPSAGGASVSVSVTTTANVTVASSGTGNVVTGLTANGSVVTEHRGTIEGGSGGGVPINGERPTNWTFNASYPFTATTTTNATGGTITFGLSGSAGTVVIPAGNTSTSFIYYVDTNAQFYTASPIATQLLFFAIGSAAGYSAGGLGFRYVTCTGSQVFACYIPQGGLSVSNATAQGGWGYVRGGSATSTNGNYATSGAGSLAVLTDTNVVIHLGGAGGTAFVGARVNGGGVNGYSYGTTSSGSGATATNHGAAATATAGATAGSSTNGGNGTAAGGAYPGSGGGGGPFAGGGGCGVAGATGGPGGAGSTDVGDGYTARSAPDSASPPSTDNVLYKTPYGVGITTITNNARANSGFLAIVSYPSP